MQEIKSRNAIFDILKLFLTFLIIVLHFAWSIPDSIRLTLTRIGVPTFFIISGYFLYHSDSNIVKKRTMKAVKKGIIIAIIAIISYFIAELFLFNNTRLLNIKYLIISMLRLAAFQEVDFGFLWYIISYPIGILFAYLINKSSKDSTKICITISAILLIFNLLLGNYSNLLNINISLICSRNAYFCATPFILIGILLKKHKDCFTHKEKLFISLGLLFFALQYFEFTLLNKIFIFNHTDLFVSTIFASICLFTGLSSLNLNGKMFYKIFKPNITLYIYLLQSFINKLFFKIPYLRSITSNPCYFLLLFVILFILSHCLCSVIELIKIKKR